MLDILDARRCAPAEVTGGNHVAPPPRQANAAVASMVAAHPHIDWFDRQLLKFVVEWAPYWPPAEDDVFPAFGMSTADVIIRFERRAAEYLSLARGLDAADLSLLGPVFSLIRSGATRRWRDANEACCKTAASKRRC